MSIVKVEDKSLLLILFEDIKSAILNDSDLNALEKDKKICEVLIWNSQYENLNEDSLYNHKFPFVAVELSIDWQLPAAMSAAEPLGHAINQRKGLCTVVLHVINTHRDNDTETFLYNEPIRHLVHRAVDRMINQNGFYTELQKIDDQLPIGFEQVQDYSIVYETQVIEPGIIRATESTLNNFNTIGSFE